VQETRAATDDDSVAATFSNDDLLTWSNRFRSQKPGRCEAARIRAALHLDPTISSKRENAAIQISD
jgi:hypothetical protein